MGRRHFHVDNQRQARKQPHYGCLLECGGWQWPWAATLPCAHKKFEISIVSCPYELHYFTIFHQHSSLFPSNFGGRVPTWNLTLSKLPTTRFSVKSFAGRNYHSLEIPQAPIEENSRSHNATWQRLKNVMANDSGSSIIDYKVWNKKHLQLYWSHNKKKIEKN